MVAGALGEGSQSPTGMQKGYKGLPRGRILKGVGTVPAGPPVRARVTCCAQAYSPHYPGLNTEQLCGHG